MVTISSYQGIEGLFKNPEPNQFIIHFCQSSNEGQNPAFTFMEHALAQGNFFLYLSDEKDECEALKKQLVLLKTKPSYQLMNRKLIIRHLQFTDIFNDVKNLLCELVNIAKNNTGSSLIYLIIKINECHSLDFYDLLDSLERLNHHLFFYYKAILLVQLNSLVFNSMEKELLKTIYPLSTTNNRLLVNRLYTNPAGEKYFCDPTPEGKFHHYNQPSSVSSLNLARYETDENGNIIYFNYAFEALTGFSPDELSACQEHDLIRGRKELEATASHRHCLNGTAYRLCTQFSTKDEQVTNTEEIVFQLEGSPITHHLVNNYHPRLAKYSPGCSSGFFKSIFNNMDIFLFTIQPFYDQEGNVSDFKIICPHNRLGRGLNKYFSIDAMHNLKYSRQLWLESIKIASKSDKQTFFEIFDQPNERFFNVILFSSSRQEIIVLVVDVTIEKRIEGYYQEQIIFLQNIMDGIPTPAFYRDTNGNFQYANKAFEIALGLAREDILGESLFKVLPEDLASKYRAMDIDLLENAGIQTYEWEFQHADGSRHNVIFNKAPLSNSENEFIGVIGTFIDVTQRKIIQSKLSLSEDKFRNMFNQSPLGIALYTPTGELVDINMAAMDILGIDAIGDIGHFNLYSDKHYKLIDGVRLRDIEVISYEEEFDFDKVKKLGLFKTSKTGKSYVRYFINPLRYGKSSIAGFMVHIQDITEQKKATRALQASEESLRRLTDNMIDMVGQVDLIGNYEYISPSCEKMLGFSPDEMIGCSFYDFLHPQDVARVKADFKAAFYSKSFVKFECRYRCRDGDYLYLETLVNLIFDKKNRICGSVLVTRDISERKRMEGELSKLDRLKTIGEMAAGLGHEIRNPMTTVRGFLQMLGTNPELSNYKDVFDLMIKELDDANSIITEFLSLAKDKPLELEIENLNNILMAIYPLLSADAIKCDKQVVIDLKPVPNLMLDAKEIRQLVFNLTRNGLEAMTGGGVLSIRTLDTANAIVLEIQDQGAGIDEKILDNLGTPFYTTKEMGIGLGLPICFNIASRNNATIEVKTSKQGTTFWVGFRKN